MKITILCVGKIKENYFTEAVREYVKRLSRYARVEITEVEDEKTPDKASPAENEAIKAKEGQKLLSRMPEDAWVTALAIDGKAPDSVELSRKIARHTGAAAKAPRTFSEVLRRRAENRYNGFRVKECFFSVFPSERHFLSGRHFKSGIFIDFDDLILS